MPQNGNFLVQPHFPEWDGFVSFIVISLPSVSKEETGVSRLPLAENFPFREESLVLGNIAWKTKKSILTQDLSMEMPSNERGDCVYVPS